MAVVQLRNGIYVNSIETVPDADQTAAYKYASLFTKSRKENWTMSQRQAASEIADAKARDAALLDVYGKQLKDYNDRLKQLDQDIALTGRDVAKANAATQRTALQEATARQNNEILWEKTKAEQVSVAGGSKSSSKSSSSGSSTGTGGGGVGSKVKGLDKTGKDSGDAIRLKMSDAPTGTASRIGAVQKDLVERTGELDMSTDMSAMGNHATAVGQLVDERQSEYINQGWSVEDAKDQAETEILGDLDNSAYRQWGAGYVRAQTIRDTEAGGGGTSSSTRESSSSSSSVRDPSTLQNRYKGLPDKMPAATEIKPPTVTVDTEELKAKRKELADQLAELIKQGAPASTVDDFITRSREIMAGRFGSQQVSPNYYQRNAAQKISGMSDAAAKALYDKYKGGGGDGAAGGGTLTPSNNSSSISDTIPPIVPGDGTSSSGANGSGANGSGANGDGTSSSSQESLPEAESQQLTDTSPPVRIPTDRLTSPEPGPTSSAADTAAASGASPAAVGAAAGAAAAAVPTAADTVRAVENTRLNNFPNRMTELDAMFPDGNVPQEILDAAANMQRSNPPPSAPRPQMQNPGGATDTAGPYAGQRSDTTPNIGSKPEAVGDFNIPDMPGAYNDRTFDPVTNPYGGDFAPNKDYPPVPGEGGARFETTDRPDGVVPMSDSEREQIIRLKQKAREDAQRKQREIDDAKKAKPSGKTGYFQLRFDNAKEIVSQPGKLARLIASGPGKVAADVYNANKASGKDFKLTYDTLTATYEDDKEALATAHQVALALDIASRNRTAPPKA